MTSAALYEAAFVEQKQLGLPVSPVVPAEKWATGKLSCAILGPMSDDYDYLYPTAKLTWNGRGTAAKLTASNGTSVDVAAGLASRVYEIPSILELGSQSLFYLPTGSGKFQVLDPLPNNCNSLWADRWRAEWPAKAEPVIAAMAAAGVTLELISIDWEPKRHSEQIRVEGSWKHIWDDERWPEIVRRTMPLGIATSDLAKATGSESNRAYWGAFINQHLYSQIAPVFTGLWRKYFPSVRFTCTQFRRRVPHLVSVTNDARDQPIGCGEAFDISSCQIQDGSPRGYFVIDDRSQAFVSPIPGRTDFWSRFLRDHMLRQSVFSAAPEKVFLIRWKPFGPPVSSRDGHDYAKSSFWDEAIRHIALASSNGMPILCSVDGDEPETTLRQSHSYLDSLLRECSEFMGSHGGGGEVIPANASEMNDIVSGGNGAVAKYGDTACVTTRVLATGTRLSRLSFPIASSIESIPSSGAVAWKAGDKTFTFRDGAVLPEGLTANGLWVAHR